MPVGWKPTGPNADSAVRHGNSQQIMLSVLVSCSFLLQVMVVLPAGGWVPACHMMLGGYWVVSCGLMPAFCLYNINTIGYLLGSKGEHI